MGMLSPAGVARVSAALQAQVDAGRVAGLVALIARRGRVAYLECFGQADREAGLPMRPDTIVRIYSMTKPVTTVATLMLVEEGRLGLDDPLARYLPCFAGVRVFLREPASGFETVPAAPPPTIRHLLSHTAGLVHLDPTGSPMERLLSEPGCDGGRTTRQHTLAAWVLRVAELPLALQPLARRLGPGGGGGVGDAP